MRQVSVAVPGRPGLLPEEAQFPFVRDPRPARRRVAQALQGVGHDEPDLRGGPGAVWPRARSQYLDAVQGARHLGSPEGLAHSLQAGRVSTRDLTGDF